MTAEQVAHKLGEFIGRLFGKLLRYVRGGK